MGLFRVALLGTAGLVAYKLWKQQQAKVSTSPTYEIDYGDSAPPHREARLGRTIDEDGAEPTSTATPASRKSRSS